MEVVFNHLPAGGPAKMLVHYAQEIQNHGNFQQFDYGIVKNLKRYGQRNPPSYPVGMITVPTHLFHSSNDWLAMPKVNKNLLVNAH